MIRSWMIHGLAKNNHSQQKNNETLGNFGVSPSVILFRTATELTIKQAPTPSAPRHRLGSYDPLENSILEDFGKTPDNTRGRGRDVPGPFMPYLEVQDTGCNWLLL